MFDMFQQVKTFQPGLFLVESFLITTSVEEKKD